MPVLASLLALTALSVAEAARPELGNTSWACDPIDPAVCGLPFPNNFFRGQNGFLNLTKEVFPLTGDGTAVDPEKGGWNHLDGFSASVSLLAFMPAVDISGCATATSIHHSLDATSPVIVMDVDTGALVPHWVELDESAGFQQVDTRLLMIWPAQRLEDGHRYLVGLRGLSNRTGHLIEPSAAFAAIRDGTKVSDPVIDARRAALEPLFDVTAKAGWKRAEHQLMWDFTVQSTRTQTNRMVAMRDDAFKRTEKGISFVFDKVIDKPSSNVRRELHGIMTVPWYLTQQGPGKQVRVKTTPNDTNVPEFAFNHVVDFTVIIPNSVVDNYLRAPILQYGHGLFGDQVRDRL